MSLDTAKDCITTQEVADMHGVSRGAVMHWITDGHLKATKFGRDWFVYRQDAINYIRRPKTGRPRKDGK